MNKQNKNSGVSGENGSRLFEISTAIYGIIAQRYGVSMPEICAHTWPKGNVYKARILFAGILAAFEVPPGTIARLLRKTTERIEGYIAEYNHQLATNAEFQQITNEVKDSLTINI